MNNFLSDLQPRERSLLLIAASLILSMSLIFGINSYVSKYSFSVKNLQKVKSDYDYVYSKALTLERQTISEYITNKNLDILVKSENLSSVVTNINILNNESAVSIKFNSENLKDAISLSEKIANNSNMKLSKIIYTQDKNIMLFELILN
jgi:hypothetical protein